jgi:hypothetical protein
VVERKANELMYRHYAGHFTQNKLLLTTVTARINLVVQKGKHEKYASAECFLRLLMTPFCLRERPTLLTDATPQPHLPHPSSLSMLLLSHSTFLV